MAQEYLPAPSNVRLADLMKEHNISQPELAKEIGCSKSTISRFISGAKGTLTHEQVLKIARLFNVSTDNDTANFQMPEEGYYSNDFDEILNITKEDDGTYRIEYSVTHLLYVENAIGTYDSETGILSFSGKDDRENDIKAEIENKGDHLEVTVTQSNYEDIIGTKQEFFQADE